MSVSTPSQWNGSEPRRPPACSDCVRRAPWQVKFQTRPSSLPSAWHDAHARKPPAFEWKTRWPVSLRLTVESGMVLLAPGSASIAGSRDCTTIWPEPSNATAIGSPTVWGTDGSGDAAGDRRPRRKARAARSGHAPGGAVPLGARGARAARGFPSRATACRPRSPAPQGPCMPSGMQPIWSSVTLPVSETNTRVRSGCAVARNHVGGVAGRDEGDALGVLRDGHVDRQHHAGHRRSAARAAVGATPS